jgi:hypothetical protein
MNSETFTYWLQGFVEIQQSESITDTQWLIIKDHLKLVFDKKTPDRNANLFARDPLDNQKLVDLISSNKTFTWPYNPLQITC